MENKFIVEKYNQVDIYQAKPLIEACKEFDINEGRLFYLGLLELRPQLSEGKGQQEFDRIVVPTSDVIKLFGGNKTYYQRLRTIAKKLQSRLVTVKEGEESFHRINIFREMQFDKKKGGLSIKFNEDMRPYILELADKPYTKIAAKTIFALSSVYAIRLLELLLEYQNIPKFKMNKKIERYISIEDLRFYCNVNKKKYSKTGDFTRNVVKRPLEEINKSTRYKVSFTCKKVGRSIVGYDFVMNLPAGPESSESIEEIIESAEIAKLEKVRNSIPGSGLYAELIQYGIGKIVAKRLIEKYSEEQIRNNIKYTFGQAGVRNKAAYLRRAIEEDYYATRLQQPDLFTVDDEPDCYAEDFAALRKLGFGEAVSNAFIGTVKSGSRFGITERSLCESADILPEVLYDALKTHDFSALASRSVDVEVKNGPITEDYPRGPESVFEAAKEPVTIDAIAEEVNDAHEMSQGDNSPELEELEMLEEMLEAFGPNMNAELQVRLFQLRKKYK